MRSFKLLVLLLALVATWQLCEVEALSAREMKRALRVIHRRPEFSRKAINRYYKIHPQGGGSGVKQPWTFNYTHALIDSWLQSLVPLSDVTILLPATIFQIATLPSADQQNVLTYHVISTMYTYRQLTEIKGTTKLDTVQGSQMTKLGPNYQPFVGFNGTINPLQLAFPAALIVPNVWVGSAFTIQMISNVLTPPASSG